MEKFYYVLKKYDLTKIRHHYSNLYTYDGSLTGAEM